MSEENKENKLKIVLPIVVIIVIIGAAIGGYFAYLKTNKSNTKWGKLYEQQIIDISSNLEEISSLKEESENRTSYIQGLPYGTNDIKAEFIDIDTDSTPELVMTYNYNNTHGMTVYYIENDNVKYYNPIQNGKEIALLYDIESKEYNYYLHEYYDDSKSSRYVKASEMKTNFTGDINYIYINDDEIESKLEVAEGEVPILSKFDQTFIEVDNNAKQFDITANMDEKTITENIKSSEKEYKDINEIITDDIKTSTENKVKEIETTKEEIKVAEEEKAKKEAEEKARAEEEARKKAEEEAKKGLKVGNKTVKYGRYKGKYAAEGEILTLNSDGTAKIESSSGTQSFTVSVGKYDFAQDITSDYKDAILLYKNGEKYMGLYVNSDGDLVLEPNFYTYIGN